MRFRSLLMILLAGVTMFALGWISFHRSPGTANITIDTEKIGDDTAKAVATGKELINDAERAIEEASREDTTDSSGSRDPDATTADEETVDRRELPREDDGV